MKLDKVASINLLLKKASRIVADLKSEKGDVESKAEIDLLSLLFQIQSVVISNRAERCLKEFVAESGTLLEKSTPDGRQADIIQLNRRQLEEDRRKLPTYIADDRRTGFADRRKKKAV
jgi:hypothetical protein